MRLSHYIHHTHYPLRRPRHLFLRHGYPPAHADVSAIRQAFQSLKPFNLQGCEIYTCCEPCPMCLSSIYWARLDKIYYAATKLDAANAGFDDDFIYQEFALKPEQRKLPMIQALKEESSSPFDIWTKSENKIEY
ncbi:hypothetical protein BVY03_00765 [bacterium K02(2017)]|nr:hypothetical protein BVY03_00765 [bacterium K02(2017)]